MAYTKQNFEDGKVLSASQLNHVEDGIATVEQSVTNTVNGAANAIKGNLSGTVVFANDVSPVEHNPIVKVRSKNMCPMSAFNSMSSNGASNTYDSATNTITVGADTPSNNFTGRYCRPVGSTCVVGTKYTISFDVRGTPGKKVSCGWDTGRITITLTGDFVRYSTTKTATRTDEVVSFYTIATTSGGLASGEYFQFANVQIEVSDAATDYTEYVDSSAVTVKRCGKNLLPNNSSSFTQNGITFTKNSDGSVKVSGTSTATTTNIFTYSADVINGERYILSGCPSGGGTGKTYVLRCYNSLGDETVRDDEGNGIEFLFNNATGNYNFAILIHSGVTINATFKPMLRLASVSDTDYEPYNGSSYVSTSGGTVDNLVSVSPNMTIMTDTVGTVVDCEYIRDSNKAIEDISNKSFSGITILIGIYLETEGCAILQYNGEPISSGQLAVLMDDGPALIHFGQQYNPDVGVTENYTMVAGSRDDSATLYCLCGGWTYEPGGRYVTYGGKEYEIWGYA